MDLLRKRIPLAALVAIAIAAAAGVAYAAIPGSDGVIRACYDKKTGVLRVIDAEAGQTCRTNENGIALAQPVSLTLGCPEGTRPFVGVCFETEPRGPAIISDARRDCAGEGRRLPTGAELFGFREQDGVTLENVEWAHDLGDVTYSSVFVYVAMDDTSSGIREASNPAAYRCVAGPTLG